MSGTNNTSEKQLMTGPRMREISFITNVVGALLTAIVLAYVSSLSSGVEKNRENVSTLTTEIKTELASIKGELKSNNIANEIRITNLESRVNQIDQIQRNRTTVFERARDKFYREDKTKKEKR